MKAGFDILINNLFYWFCFISIDTLDNKDEKSHKKAWGVKALMQSN